MALNISNPIINEIIDLASQYLDVEKIFLFGSRARGDHDERSDIDLAVQGPNLSHDDWVNLSLALEDGLYTLLVVDVIKLEKVPERLRYSIQEEGRILYERRQSEAQLG